MDQYWPTVWTITSRDSEDVHSLNVHDVRNRTCRYYTRVLIFPHALCTYEGLWWYLVLSSWWSTYLHTHHSAITSNLSTFVLHRPIVKRSLILRSFRFQENYLRLILIWNRKASFWAIRPVHSDRCLSLSVGILWPNGWMDQDATWCGGRPWHRWLCVRWGPSSPHAKGQSSSHFSAHFALARSPISTTAELIVIHCESKKQGTTILSITSPNVDRLSNFFHWQIH